MKHKNLTFSIIFLLLLIVIFEKSTIFEAPNDEITINLQTSSIPLILMNGNSDWADYKDMGYCTGNGTYSEPYIIKNQVP